MKTKSILQLAKTLDFTTEYEMYEYFITSYMNGNFSQCRRLFSELKRDAKKSLLAFLLDEGMSRECKFYFEML